MALGCNRLQTQLKIAALLAGVAITGTCSIVVRAQPPTKAAAVPFDMAKLAPIVGDPAQWKVIERFAGSTQVQDINGQPVLIVGRGTGTLASQVAFDTNSEVAVRFRVIPTQPGQVSMTLQMALADAADLKDRGIYLTIGNRGDQSAVSWSTANLETGPGQRPTKSGSYRVGFTATRSLGWPDAIRRLVEADMATAETVGEHWFTMRMALRPNKAELSLDGIPLNAVYCPRP